MLLAHDINGTLIGPVAHDITVSWNYWHPNTKVERKWP